MNLVETILIFSPFQIIIALVLDAAIGDPPWFPHPVRLIGKAAARLEKATRNRYTNPTTAGLTATVLVLLLVASATVAILSVAAIIHPLAGTLTGALVLYFSIAGRDLLLHVVRVQRCLVTGDLPGARAAVQMIVARDSQELTEEGVIRASVESVSESSCDGLVAPLFYGFLLGPLGAILYRTVNTLDSMFGYKNEKYNEFGYVPANLDDLANWLPARLSAITIVFGAFLMKTGSGRGAWEIMRRDHRNQTSPNAGWPEAAMAGALGIQLGGANVYFGEIINKATIGNPDTSLRPAHIRQACSLVVLSIGIFLGGGLLLKLLF